MFGWLEEKSDFSIRPSSGGGASTTTNSTSTETQFCNNIYLHQSQQ